MPDADPEPRRPAPSGRPGLRDGRLFGATDRADSAGLPWEGRSFERNAAAEDDGSADPALLGALVDRTPGERDRAGILEAVRTARLLVPLLARAGETGQTPEGRIVDKTQELSLATVRAPDGRAVLPAFTSVGTMSAWNRRARPVPAAGPRVALAAASEQTELIVIDPTAPTEFVLRRAMVRALATGERWTPPWGDDDVLRAFRRSADRETDVLSLTLSDGDPTGRLRGPEIQIGLGLRPGLGEEALRGIVERLTAAWASSETIAERVDSMTLRLLRA